MLVVGTDAERRDRVERALAPSCEVVHAEDTSSAVDELSLGRPLIVVIDSTLPEREVTALLESGVDPARAVLWGPKFNPVLLDYGALIQIPDRADEKLLTAAVLRLADVQSARTELKAYRARAERLEHVMAIVEEVRQEVNSPLTAIMAEVELLLTDQGERDAGERESLQTIETMTRRVRELVGRLNALGSDE